MFKARPFRLPSLEDLAGLLHSVQRGAWGAKIDVSNCCWSVHLPPAMAGAVRLAAAGTTYAPVRVPSGWHQARGLLQHLIAAMLSELLDTQVIIVQYLDDILFVGPDRSITTQVARDTAAHLARKAFIVSPKSVLDATQSLAWMRKQLSLDRPRVAHKPEGLADTMGRWVTFSLSYYTRKTLQRLIGRNGWLARPGLSAGCFLAVAHTWLRLGPLLARSVPLPYVGDFWRRSLGRVGGGSRSRPKGRRSASTLMLLLARLCEWVSFLGCGARRALPSAGTHRGSVVSSRRSCLGLCVRSMLHGILVVGMRIWLSTMWAP